MITYLQPALMIVILILTLWIQTTVSSTKCDAVESNQPSSSDEIERGSRTLIKYKSAAVASIFMAGGLGVCLPWFRKITTTTTSSDDQGHATRGGGVLIGKAFAGGVVLATGFIHVLPEAVEKLGSPCLSKTAPWGKFPFAGFMSMMFCMATLVMESVAVGFNSRVRNDDDENPDHQDDESIGRGKIISQILELGVVFDSTIIGISMGTCKSTKTIKPLMAVLSFHQFFEGVCIGESIYQAKMKLKVRVAMALFFTIIAPTGIGIGMGISKHYEDNSSTSLIVEGIFDSASAGILIYMALFDLLAAHFMSLKMMSCDLRVQLWSYVSLILGATCMSVLDIFS